MKQKLLIATHNRGKLREYQEIFEDLNLQLLTLDDVGIAEDVAETGATFEENAFMKAIVYSQMSGLFTLADDSGLEVDALNGEPGVFSKRYAGDEKTDAERNAYLLEKMRGVPREKRTARFQCVIVMQKAEPFEQLQMGNAYARAMRAWKTEGTCEGEIAFEPRGMNGFGYDPIFIVGDTGKHLAEFSSEEKNKISHRGRAAVKAREILQTFFRDMKG